MTLYYLDSSVALHGLLDPTGAAAAWLDASSAAGDELMASRILQTEVLRVLRRESLPVSRADALLDGVSLIPVSDPVLQIAEGIRPHVRTLDAIHLATAVHLQLGVTVVSHDARMREVAGLLELDAHYPV